MIHLLLGGARSGKSRRAVALAAKARGRRVVFLATALRRDAEMHRRIAAHRRERPASWVTVEESRAVPEALARLPVGTTVILDCVTLWVSRLVSDGLRSAPILAATDRLLGVARRRRLRLVVVSNEVGSGAVPLSTIGRRFQDTLGAVNARLAARANRVELLVAGLPLRVRG